MPFPLLPGKESRLICFVGVKPTEVGFRNFEAWIEGERETKLLSIDEKGCACR
jgi:hypothetical protein